MRDISGSIQRSESWTARGAARDVFESLLAEARHGGGRVKLSVPCQADIWFGSRTLYRALSQLSPTRVVPCIAQVTVRPRSNGICEVQVQLSSNQGHYVPIARKLQSPKYYKAYECIVARFRAAAAPLTIDST